MSYKILSKFIKDISFEIPDAQTFVLIEKEIQNYNLSFDIKSKKFKENIIEINTILKIVPKLYFCFEATIKHWIHWKMSCSHGSC